jgi:hypothetical protein
MNFQTLMNDQSRPWRILTSTTFLYTPMAACPHSCNQYYPIVELISYTLQLKITTTKVVLVRGLDDTNFIIGYVFWL